MISRIGNSRAGSLGLSSPRGALSKHVGGIVPSLRTASQGYAAKWQGSEDIRKEFGTFEAYAASMATKVKR